MATDTPFLGYATVGGSVLYLALEDSDRRLQERSLKQRGLPFTESTDCGTPRLCLCTDCPPLDQGGLDKIRLWLEGTPDARLVIIDTFPFVRSQERSGGPRSSRSVASRTTAFR